LQIGDHLLTQSRHSRDSFLGKRQLLLRGPAKAISAGLLKGRTLPREKRRNEGIGKANWV
jgi:hypothetical protein